MIDIIELLDHERDKGTSLIALVELLRGMDINVEFKARDLYHVQYGAIGAYLMRNQDSFYYEY